MTPKEIQKMKDDSDACVARGKAHDKERIEKRKKKTWAERIWHDAKVKQSFFPNVESDVDRPEEDWT